MQFLVKKSTSSTFLIFPTGKMLIYVEIFDLKITLVQYELMHNFGGQRVNKNCTLD